MGNIYKKVPVLSEDEWEPKMSEIHLSGKFTVYLFPNPQLQIPHTNGVEAQEEDEVNYINEEVILPLYNWVEIGSLIYSCLLIVSLYP